MFDIVVIGGGPAGLSAGLYGARAGLSVLIIERMFSGGQAATTYEIANYPGFDEVISGPDLAKRMEAQAMNAGVRFAYEDVTALSLNSIIKEVTTTKTTYQARAVILAMGGAPRMLGLEGESRLKGMGISYCATCDGAFFKGKVVAVVGGGDTACEDAIFLSRYCEKVYLIHRRDTLRAAKALQTAVLKTPNVEPIWNSTVTALGGGIDILESVTVHNSKTGSDSELKISGLFVAIGTSPSSSLAEGKVELSRDGYILTDENMKTNVAGVFAAGDIRKKSLRQIVTAASDGAIAAYNAALYIGL